MFIEQKKITSYEGIAAFVQAQAHLSKATALALASYMIDQLECDREFTMFSKSLDIYLN